MIRPKLLKMSLRRVDRIGRITQFFADDQIQAGYKAQGQYYPGENLPSRLKI